MKIVKSFETETAHIVRGATSNRCKRSVHGHSYKWDVEIFGVINPVGMVVDFIELKPIREFIDQLDHAMVLWERDDVDFMNFFKNSCERVVIMKQNTTAENMARLVHKFVNDWLSKNDHHFHSCLEVRVHETRTGCGIANDSDENDVLVHVQS